MAGHNDEEEDDGDNDSDNEPLETSLGSVKHKSKHRGARSSSAERSYFTTCGKKGHKALAAHLKNGK